MSLHQGIKSQLVGAMKAKDTLRLNVIRGLLASFTNEAIAKKRKPDEELSDDEVLIVISETYLPVQMSRDEIIVYIQSKPLPQASEKNKFLGVIMKELKGKADGSMVKEIIDTIVV